MLPFKVQANSGAYPPLITHRIFWLVQGDTECFEADGPVLQWGFTYMLGPNTFSSKFQIRAEFFDSNLGVHDKHEGTFVPEKCRNIPS